MGAHLAVPHSAQEHQRVLRAIELASVTAAWLGLTFTKTENTDPAAITWQDGTNLLTAPYKEPWGNNNLQSLMYN